MDIFEERVAAGTAWLDDHAPAEWWDRIDLITLDISDGDRCVLGQVFAADADQLGFINGYIAAEYLFPHIRSGTWQGPRGFCAGDDEYPFLNVAWMLAIEKRRAEVYA
jgi:hypothetical protein